MIIPEDGNLPKITRKGFAAFNNIMLIKVPDKLKKPGETTYQLATLDRSKKGERWPADKYVDIMLNTPVINETNSDENFSNYKEDAKKNSIKYGKFLPKKFKTKEFSDFSRKDQSQNVRSTTPPISPIAANSKPHFQNAYQESQVPQRRFRGDKHVKYDNKRTFKDANRNYRHHQNKFSNDRQSYGGRDNVHGEGTSSNPNSSRYGLQNHVANETVSMDPAIRDRPYNSDFDFQRSPPIFLNTYVPNPQENNFPRPEISNPNFGPPSRLSDEYFVPNDYERPMIPPYNSNRPEFINNNNFERQPFHHDPMGSGYNNSFNASGSVGPGLNNNFNAGNNRPLLVPGSVGPGLNNNFNVGNNRPLLSPPPPLVPQFENFNNGQFQNNFYERNPHYNQEVWNNRNEPNQRYAKNDRNQRMHKKSRKQSGAWVRKNSDAWRGRAPNKFSKGKNNRQNNRYGRREPS